MLLRIVVDHLHFEYLDKGIWFMDIYAKYFIKDKCSCGAIILTKTNKHNCITEEQSYLKLIKNQIESYPNIKKDRFVVVDRKTKKDIKITDEIIKSDLIQHAMISKFKLCYKCKKVPFRYCKMLEPGNNDYIQCDYMKDKLMPNIKPNFEMILTSSPRFTDFLTTFI